MAQSPADKLRPALQVFAKYHFWMLALIVPFIVVPALFMAKGVFLKKVAEVRDRIKSLNSSLKSVNAKTQHPNPKWVNDIDSSTMRVKRETLAEWRRFWNSQAPLRTWPEDLGQDFVKAVATLKADGKLSRKLLERYQDVVRTLVRDLPTRMAVEDLMRPSGGTGETGGRGPVSAAGPGAAAGSGLSPGPSQPGGATHQPEESAYVAIWNPTNQQQIYSSFEWEKPPTTTMVLMAQEELHVYGLLCDAIARINKPATGPHNAAIAVVNALLVGYPAAADIPGGATKGRIRSPEQAGGGSRGMGGAMGSMDMGGGGESGSGGGKPAHPRFSSSGKSGMGGSMTSMMSSDSEEAAPAPAAAGEDDQALRSWVYVDFKDHPLDATQLASSPDAKMIHLMPFVLKVVMDQRKIDAFLVELATAAVPIDVRQVRINATGGASGGAGSGGGMGGMMMSQSMGSGAGGSGMSGSSASSSEGRIYDVPVEIYGTVGLATPPSEVAVGLEPGQDAEPAGEEGEKQAAPKAAAALPHRRTSA